MAGRPQGWTPEKVAGAPIFPAMDPATLDLEPFTELTTWEGIPSLTIQRNGTPPPGNLASAEMRFQRTDAAEGSSKESERVVLSSADESQIQIVDAAQWEIYVLEQVVPGLTEGNWRWVLETTDDAGKPWIYVIGTITAKPNVNLTA
jgi:hypothetical protein